MKIQIYGVKILIFGLPGSGKSTLAKELDKLFGDQSVWLNADAIRTRYNDWDFSPKGRLRQVMRMGLLADGIKMSGKVTIADFVCPTKRTRKMFNADYAIWMDTIQEGRFEDTNKMFEKPQKNQYNFCFTKWTDPVEMAKLIIEHI